MRILFSLAFLIALSGIAAAVPASTQARSALQVRTMAATNACNFAELDQEIRQNSRNTNAYATRAACYLMPSPGLRGPSLRNIVASVADSEAALKLDPQNFYARHNYAQAAYLMGFDQFAVGEFTKAIALNPRSARSYLGRGWAYSNLCQMNNMASDFTQAVRLDPSLAREVASPQQIAQHRIECSRPPPPPQAPHNCPHASIFAFSLNARFLLENEWKARHPGCPL